MDWARGGPARALGGLYLDLALSFIILVLFNLGSVQLTTSLLPLVAVQGERQAWADKLVALASSDWRSELRTEIDAAHRTLLMRARSVAKQ